jgi:hypothetical protein
VRSAPLSTFGDVASFLELSRRRDDACIDEPAAEGIANLPFFPIYR